VALYPGFHGWVIEKWLSAEKYAGSPMVYHLTNFDEDSGLYSTGPYPSRGEYSECQKLPEGIQPSLDFVVKIIQLTERSRNYTRKQKEIALRDDELSKEKAHSDRNEDILREARKKTFKRTEILDIENRLRYSAQDLGMPTKPGAFFQPREKRIEICQG
jgi:hypothetical protein